jgi:hypothetical protein
VLGNTVSAYPMHPAVMLSGFSLITIDRQQIFSHISLIYSLLLNCSDRQNNNIIMRNRT